MKRRNLGEAISTYRIVEVAGVGDWCSVYLATTETGEGLYWVLESTEPLEDVAQEGSNQTFLNIEDLHYLIYPVANASLGMLREFVPGFELQFIGWRWADLAEAMGQLHKAGQVYQSNRVFALSHFFFTASGKLILPTLASVTDIKMAFPASEPRDELSPASDVYSLAAALMFLLGDLTPPEAFATDTPQARGALQQYPRLRAILRQALSYAPHQRQQNGLEFARALKKAAPRAKIALIKQPVPLDERMRGLGSLFSGLDTLVVRVVAPLVLVVMILVTLFLTGNLIPPGLMEAIRKALSASGN